MSAYRAKHHPCACGCGELADECMSGRSNPLAAFTITNPKWADLIGIDPNFTGGKPVDEWLDEQRGEA